MKRLQWARKCLVVQSWLVETSDAETTHAQPTLPAISPVGVKHPMPRPHDFGLQLDEAGGGGGRELY